MFEPLEPQEEQVIVGLSALNKSTQLDCDYFIPFNQLSEDVIADLQLDLLLVSGASALQTALVKFWCEEIGCVAACVESLEHDEKVVEQVIANVKTKLDGSEFPNNIDVADIRYLTDDDHQLMAFDSEEKLIAFLSDEDCPCVTGLLCLVQGEFDLESYQTCSNKLSACLSDNVTFFYSYCSQGMGECSALISVSR